MSAGVLLACLNTTIMTNEEVREKVPQTYGQRMLFTGPDGLGDYRTRFCDFPQHVGNSSMSPEATSDVNYLFRASPNPLPPPLGQRCVGGVGWGLQYHQLLNSETLFSNMQIKRSEIRSTLEDRATHRYQNPWTAPPHFLDKQSAGARGRLAWTPNMYDSYSKDVNQRFLLNKRDDVARRHELVRVSKKLKELDAISGELTD